MSETDELRDAVHKLLGALKAIVDRDLTYYDGSLAEGQIPRSAIVNARRVIAEVEAKR